MSNARNLAGIVTETPSTTALSMPVGTTAQRPVSPETGMYRMNSTTGEPEWYDTVSGTWVTFRNGAPYSVESLVIAGGGGGGVHQAGGGGAGGAWGANGSGSTTGGGGGGAAVSGNANVTWAATGTRLGAIA